MHGNNRACSLAAMPRERVPQLLVTRSDCRIPLRPQHTHSSHSHLHTGYVHARADECSDVEQQGSSSYSQLVNVRELDLLWLFEQGYQIDADQIHSKRY